MRGESRVSAAMGRTSLVVVLVLSVLAAFVAVADASPVLNDRFVQRGDSVLGENPVANFLGSSVALSGDGNTFVASGDPAERVYRWNGSAWAQLGSDIVSPSSNASGANVAISANGNRILIAESNASDDTQPGRSRIYQWNGNSWNQLGSDIFGEEPDDWFGAGGVAMSGDGETVAVAAPRNGADSGSVRIFTRNGNVWNQLGSDIDGEAAGDAYDGSLFTRNNHSVDLSVDGTTVAIGAGLNDAAGVDAGHARIFRWNGNTWNQLGSDIDGDAADDRFGFAVALSADGQTLAVSAPFTKITGQFGPIIQGETRVFTFNGSQWNQLGNTVEPGGVERFFGEGVDLSDDGTRLLVVSDRVTGDVTLYDRVGTNWTLYEQIVSTTSQGNAVGGAALSASGATVVMSMPIAELPPGIPDPLGAVQVFDESCNGLRITVDIGAGDVPTPGDDVILGTQGADLIVASGGDDTICGLGGNDTINAGAGDDWVDAGAGADTVFGVDGNDEIMGDAGADEIIGGNGRDTIDGGGGDDAINGGPGNDTIFGRAGNDTIFGQGGNDTIQGNFGNDAINGADGADTILGGQGNDVLNGGLGNDLVEGNAGNDVIFGLGGSDDLHGGNDDDFVLGQFGADTVEGGAGDDLLFGNENNDVLRDSSGVNTINGGGGDDDITGGSGADRIFGDGDLAQAGDDILRGGGGQDLLLGFAGDDTIIATDGVKDTVNGGPGTDSCTVDSGAVSDDVFNCEP